MWLYCFHFFIPLPILIVGTIFLLPFLDVVRMSKSTVSFFLDSGILTQQNALLWCVIRLLEVVSVSYLWALSNYFSYMLFIFILYFFNSFLYFYTPIEWKIKLDQTEVQALNCILPGIDTPFCTAVVHSVYIGFRQLIRVFGKSLFYSI